VGKGKVEQALEKEFDQNRLLQGEDPESQDPEDIRHWIQVYQELVNFKERLIATAVESLHEAIDSEASREIASTDLVTLRAELQRFRARLDFWERKAAKLERPERPKRD
jgi:hypothetical protein